MRRVLSLVVAASLVVAGAAATAYGQHDVVNRAVEALGGANTLTAVRTFAVKGTVRQWEPEQSIVPGGEMRAANESTFEAVTDLVGRAARIDWVRNYVYPATRTYTFTEIVTPDAGYVAGIDSTARNKQNLESNPPAHAMSGLRLAATLRELRRSSPLLLAEMRQNPARVSSAGTVTINGASYPAVNYRVGDQTYIVLFDRQSGLPTRIRTLDYDSVWGDVNYDLVLSDWQSMSGIRVATSHKYELNGRVITETKITDFKTNVPVPPDRVTIPAAFREGAPKPAAGSNVPYQWVIRRPFIGTYLDSDNPSFDTRRTSSLTLTELAPGIQHVVGGSHNALIVEMSDHLIVVDAPVSDAQSKWTLDAARQKFGAKPVKYLILTHHHMDHIGGFRAYAAQGATLVVGKGAGDHFRHIVAAPFRRNPDLPPQDLSKTPIVEVADKRVFTDGKREVQAIVLDNPHAQSMLIAYVPDAKLGFVTDVWSPGRDPLPPKITPPLAALVAGVKKAGITPVKFAGGHGSSADYQPLAELAEKP
jgi:glyoxylase-like metal-dependent hydrolase (beta-lactamase superfamily II)